MVDIKGITNLIPTIMSIGLAKHNLDYVTSKKKKKKSLIKLGIDNIVGSTMISATAKNFDF